MRLPLIASFTLWVEAVIWKDQNKDGKTKILLKIKGNGP